MYISVCDCFDRFSLKLFMLWEVFRLWHNTKASLRIFPALNGIEIEYDSDSDGHKEDRENSSSHSSSDSITLYHRSRSVAFNSNFYFFLLVCTSESGSKTCTTATQAHIQFVLSHRHICNRLRCSRRHKMKRANGKKRFGNCCLFVDCVACDRCCCLAHIFRVFRLSTRWTRWLRFWRASNRRISNCIRVWRSTLEDCILGVVDAIKLIEYSHLASRSHTT